MKKRLLKAAICSALVVAFAAPAFAAAPTTTTTVPKTATTTDTTVNAFSDVPANSWAYGAVEQLVKDGIVSGYPDRTFKGDKTMTRYEMAQVVAKAMHQTMTADQKAIVDKLAREYGAELENLGVKVDGMQRQLDNQVKISGDARVRYFNSKDADDTTDYRARISFDGNISDNMRFNARLSSGNQNATGPAVSSIDGNTNAGTIKLDTANVSFDMLDLSTTVGRQDLKLGSGFLSDTQMNGLSTNLGNLNIFGGVAVSNAVAANTEKVYGAEYKANLLGAAVTADYLKNTTQDTNIYGLNTSFELINGVTANAEYYKNNGFGGGSAAAYGAKLDNLGLSATYRNVKPGIFSDLSTLAAVGPNAQLADDLSSNGFAAAGFKGMEYQYDQEINKNAGLTVKYQDFKDQQGAKIPNRVSAAINVKF